jgi:8-oxo-dGTP pyrophosphatase MutT (NUDIX family)
MTETKNPWKVISRATVYDNPWIQVDHHEVLNPAGRPGIYGVVRFKNYAIGVVPIDEDGNLLLVGQHRFPSGEYSWEIPEGGGPVGGSALESAQRELQEECGVTAKNWLEIVQMDLSNSVTDERGVAFLAWDLGHGSAQPDDEEELQVARVAFKDALERVKRGEIRDSLSVAAILKVALMAFEGELPEPLQGVIRVHGRS